MIIDFKIPYKEFVEEYQEKKPLVIKGAFKNDSFSWEDINGIYERSKVESDNFKLSYDGIRPKSEYVESYWSIGDLKHKLIKPVLYEYMSEGATLISNKIENEIKVNELEKQISNYTKRQVISSAYLAFGERDSFRCHWDTRDVFALQVVGRKRWIIYEPSLQSPLYTQQSKYYEKEYPCPDNPYMDIVLEEGDLLYLPRGWWHNPLPLGEPTFHLAFGVFPAYIIDYVNWAMKFIPDFLEARSSISNWGNDKHRVEKLTSLISDCLCNESNYDKFLEEHISHVRSSSPLNINKFVEKTGSSSFEGSTLRLNKNSYMSSDGYVISNGVKINVDDSGKEMFDFFFEREQFSFEDVCNNFPSEKKEAIEKTIKRLCFQDVLELIL
jgi:ribosomal protein L16 Arg81 hydroxylase